MKERITKKKKSVYRVVLNKESANAISELIKKLRVHSCKTDTSKTVNVILSIFFQKYCSIEHENIVRELFDKKSYLRTLINNSSPEAIDESIKQYLMEINIKKMDLERKQFNKRLSFLLDSGHTEVNQALKDEYRERYLDKKVKEQKLTKKRNQLQLFQKKLSNIQRVGFNKENFKNMTKAFDYTQKNDLVSLKATYQYLFQKIIVQPQDESRVQLRFIFKGVPLASSKDEDFYCISNRMAVRPGLEPLSLLLRRQMLYPIGLYHSK